MCESICDITEVGPHCSLVAPGLEACPCLAEESPLIEG